MASQTVTVASSNDDAAQKSDGSGFSATGGTIQIVASATPATRAFGAFVFDGIVPPAGTSLVAATLKLFSLTNGTMLSHIAVEDGGDAQNFTDSATITGRTFESTTVAWSAATTAFAYVTSPDISSVLDQYFADGSYVVGNSMCIAVQGDSSGSATAAVSSIDHATLPVPAQLYLEWAGGGGSVGAGAQGPRMGRTKQGLHVPYGV